MNRYSYTFVAPPTSVGDDASYLHEYMLRRWEERTPSDKYRYGNYHTNAPAIVLSSWDRARKVTLCGTTGFNNRVSYCNCDMLCDTCAGRKTRRSYVRYQHAFTLAQNWYAITYSFKSNLFLESCTKAEYLHRYEVAHAFIQRLRADDLIQGAYAVRELAINSLSEQAVFPHTHIVCNSDRADLIDSEGNLHPSIAQEAEDMNVSLRVTRITDAQSFLNEVKYPIKPLNIKSMYEEEANRHTYTSINTGLDNILNTVISGFQSHMPRIHYYGNMDARCRNSYIGTEMDTIKRARKKEKANKPKVLICSLLSPRINSIEPSINSFVQAVPNNTCTTMPPQPPADLTPLPYALPHLNKQAALTPGQYAQINSQPTNTNQTVVNPPQKKKTNPWNIAALGAGTLAALAGADHFLNKGQVTSAIVDRIKSMFAGKADTSTPFSDAARAQAASPTPTPPSYPLLSGSTSPFRHAPAGLQPARTINDIVADAAAGRVGTHTNTKYINSWKDILNDSYTAGQEAPYRHIEGQPGYTLGDKAINTGMGVDLSSLAVRGGYAGLGALAARNPNIVPPGELPWWLKNGLKSPISRLGTGLGSAGIGYNIGKHPAVVDAYSSDGTPGALPALGGAIGAATGVVNPPAAIFSSLAFPPALDSMVNHVKNMSGDSAARSDLIDIVGRLHRQAATGNPTYREALKRVISEIDANKELSKSINEGSGYSYLLGDSASDYGAPVLKHLIDTSRAALAK